VPIDERQVPCVRLGADRPRVCRSFGRDAGDPAGAGDLEAVPVAVVDDVRGYAALA
jgi:hypothetical protein